MRPLWRTATKAALVAVSSVTQSVVHLLLSKLESLLGLDAEVPGLHGVHREVARVPEASVGPNYSNYSTIQMVRTE